MYIVVRNQNLAFAGFDYKSRPKFSALNAEEMTPVIFKHYEDAQEVIDFFFNAPEHDGQFTIKELRFR
jgi:hypothetical protein